MADPFVGEIRMFAGNFAPKGWAFCNGQLLPLSQNTALFSLLGTIYGGDGRSNFALPNIQGRAVMHRGQGPGLSLHDQGETGGSETVTLLLSEMAPHNHTLQGQNNDGAFNNPTNNTIAGSSGGLPQYVLTAPNVDMHPDSLLDTGGGQPHNNMQPYLTLNFIIALQGVFPPRTE
jgi:microcystin-dependent protein